MSPIDPKTLEAFAEREVYQDDPKCRKCGYSLAGLPVGARCPECGTTTRRRRTPRRFGDALTDAPPDYLRNLMLAFVGMAVSGFLCAGFYGLGVVAEVGGLAAAGAGVVWWLSVVVVTGPRRATVNTEVDLAAENRGLRLLNRVTQGGWAAAGVLEFALSSSIGGLSGVAGTGVGLTTGQSALFFAMVGCLAVGLVGLGPLSAQLSDLADWANEGDLAGRLRAIALVVTGCGGYVVVAVTIIVATQGIGALVTLHGALGLPLFVAWPLTVLALLGFLFTLFQMSRMTEWAVSNAASARDRDERLLARYERAKKQADAERAAGYRVDPPQDAREG